MSLFRQEALPDEGSLLVRALATRYPHGYTVPSHRHSWPQLIFAARGVMTVTTDHGTWVVPTQRAVWVPSGVRHTWEASGTVHLRTLYVAPHVTEHQTPPLPTRCCVLGVSPLLRELILDVVARGPLDVTAPLHRHLTHVIIGMLVERRAIPVNLHRPNDHRARQVAERVLANLAEPSTLRQLAAGSGASARTLERLFRRETGTTFGRWRQQARLLAALRRLAEDVPVTTVAHEVGYESSSAFIDMFQRALGTTPGRYFASP